MENPGGVFSQKYSDDSLINKTGVQIILAIIGIVFLYTMPLWASNYFLEFVNRISIICIAAIGLNILTGVTGQISMGQAAMMAVGGYTSAILTTAVGFPFWLSLPCAALVTGLVGILFGLPSVRLKGFYLLMTTLAAHFIILYVIQRWSSLTGGVNGISNIPAPELLGYSFGSIQGFFYLIMTILLLGVFISRNLIRSKIGRAFVAIRDNDKAAQMMGVNISYYKLLSFFIGCAYAGVAGCLLVHWQYGVVPEQFTLADAVWYVGYVIIGGMGTSTLGPIFGVVFIESILEILSGLLTSLGSSLPNIFSILSAGKSIAFGIVMVLFLIYEPRGLHHRWELFKSYYRMWPFSVK